MATGDLTTLANTKAFLGIATAQTDGDTMLARLITAASKFISGRIDRQIASAAAARTLDGNGGTSILLPEYPVTAVASVVVDGETIPARSTVTGDGWVLADGDTGRVELVNYVFTRGVSNVVITCTAGYASTPEDIEQAVLELVQYRWKVKDRAGLASKSLPQGEVISFVGYQASTASVDAVIELYRRVSIG